MQDSLNTYVEWIELESFFSGYLLVYITIYIIAPNLPATGFVKIKLLPKLPLAYALVGTLYWGLQMRNMYPDYTPDNFTASTQFLYLKIWGLLSILFWIPLFRRKPVFSVLHSLVFFFVMASDIYLQVSSPSAGNDLLRNDIKILSVSILLNLIAFIMVTLTFLLISHFKRQKRSAHI